ncbi:MAG: 3-ketoacyl-ACP reductase, partial [Rhodopirellula sp.]|nr:3-ketoacyl-ACP reductase [Rhodopirellula sp.]
MATKPSPVAIITGSSRGIGAACARELALSGYRVVVNYLNNVEAAEQVCSTIVNSGGEAIICQANIGKRVDRERIIGETHDSFGRLDLLVNNAGITSQGRRDLLEATEESWDMVFDTNLKGPFFLSQLAAKQMLSNQSFPQGIIVNINSISSY